MEQTILIETLTDLREAAKSFLNTWKNEKFFAFYGEMGVGKTTFIKVLCEQLGVTEPVSSPTYSIVNEYQGQFPIYHMDFYRLKNENEAYDIGIPEYFDQEGKFFMEWPSRISSLLPEETIRIDMESLPSQQRKLTITRP